MIGSDIIQVCAYRNTFVKREIHFHDRDPVKEADCRLWQSALFFALTCTQ